MLQKACAFVKQFKKINSQVSGHLSLSQKTSLSAHLEYQPCQYLSCVFICTRFLCVLLMRTFKKRET